MPAPTQNNLETRHDRIPHNHHSNHLQLLLRRLQFRRHPRKRRPHQVHAQPRILRQQRHGVPQRLPPAQALPVRRTPHHPPAPRRRRLPAARLLGRGPRPLRRQIQTNPRRPRRRSRRLPLHRPAPPRRNGVPRRALQIRHGLHPRRRQHPPVHGDRRHRLQAVLRLRRPPLFLRRPRTVRPPRLRRRQPRRRPSRALEPRQSQ